MLLELHVTIATNCFTNYNICTSSLENMNKYSNVITNVITSNVIVNVIVQ